MTWMLLQYNYNYINNTVRDMFQNNIVSIYIWKDTSAYETSDCLDERVIESST